LLGYTETLGPLAGFRVLEFCLVLFGAGGAIAVNVFGLSTCVRVPGGSKHLVGVGQRVLSSPVHPWAESSTLSSDSPAARRSPGQC